MKLIPTLFLTFLFILTACAGNDAQRKNEKARDSLNREMKDSLTLFEKRLDSLQQAIPMMMSEVDEMLKDFDRVDNPREVEGYYILSSARKNYPLDNTGLIARITDNETLELIAALKGGFFDHICVSDSRGTVESDVVPHDQALNYRIGNFTTVAFTGEKADSVARFIAGANGSVTLHFLNPGKTGSVTLTPAQVKVITDTYRLYSGRRAINNAEKEIPLLSRKCQILRDRLSVVSEQTEAQPR